MMEFWPPARRAYASERRLGMKSGKRSILQKMLNLHSLMMLTSHITPLKYENQCRIGALSLLFLKAIIPQFHHSIIPIARP
jgi:hypothetical protein